ncbi:ATP-binding protein, partial [Endobacter medicaginis]
MRLQTLDLIRFGHFTDRRFDFGAKPKGADFHIIYGRNEAGKTTTMEGLLRLLYGFRPRNEPYEFRHQRANLRVGATMEIAGGVRSFVRIASGRATLLDGNGAVLPETALSQCLGGLTESDYRNLLCLDDATIERGGEEIVQARGDTGRLLFAAAAGLSDLSHILDTLRREADAIWAGRTTTTVIAKLRQELKVLDEEIRRHEVSANEWTTRRKAAAAAAATEAAALA